MSGEINLIFPAEEVTKWMEIFVHFWPMFVFTVFKKKIHYCIGPPLFSVYFTQFMHYYAS